MLLLFLQVMFCIITRFVANGLVISKNFRCKQCDLLSSFDLILNYFEARQWFNMDMSNKLQRGFSYLPCVVQTQLGQFILHISRVSSVSLTAGKSLRGH